MYFTCNHYTFIRKFICEIKEKQLKLTIAYIINISLTYHK